MKLNKLSYTAKVLKTISLGKRMLLILSMAFTGMICQIQDINAQATQNSVETTISEIPAEDGLVLKVMTFNIHQGRDANIEEIAKIINDADVDFVALEEVDTYTYRKNAKPHNGRNMIADLGAATNMFPLYGRTINFLGGYYGIGILSKHPCIKSEVVELPNPKDYEPRAIIDGTFLVDGEKKVIFGSTHLSVEDEATRILQAQKIIDRYSQGELPVILGGDFNTKPDKEPIRIVEKVFENLTTTAPTYNAKHPKEKLDYIYGKAPGQIELISTEVLDVKPRCSDHRPVVSKIRIKD